MALKPLALECHINLPNYPSKLELHNLGGCMPYKETKKMVYLVWPKYKLPNMEKSLWHAHDGST
jgi:hypothetical protein